MAILPSSNIQTQRKAEQDMPLINDDLHLLDDLHFLDNSNALDNSHALDD
jgi:hypothetical protein